MKLAIFSDVHGNLPALELMLQQVNTEGVTGYISLGDAVNYGPWSNECVNVLSSLPNANLLKGNHEQYFLSGHYDGNNEVAQAFFNFCYPSFREKEKIKDWKETYSLNDFSFSHTINDQYVYPDSTITLEHNTVVGHSHHQFKIEQDPFALYNPGSVGQNRKYINVINYLILETDNMQFDFRSIIYDEQLIIQEMRRQNYPIICIEYYDKKERLRR